MLLNPKLLGKWHIGIEEKVTKALKGVIIATPIKMKIKDKIVQMAVVNFVCIDRSIASKKIIPSLISELQRRVYVKGVYVGIYASKKIFPTP